MKVLIIGAHGKVGHLLIGELQSRNIDFVAGLRSQEQIKAYNENNIETQYIDLTTSLDEIKDSIEESGADVLVFSAGAGGSSDALTMEIDLDGAIKTMMVAETIGVKRYIMVSSLFSDNRNKWDATGIRPYMTAKHYADDHLRGTSLDYTIIHPGALTDEDGTGKVKLLGPNEAGSIPRVDVAKALALIIQNPSTIGKEYTFASGETNAEDIFI